MSRSQPVARQWPVKRRFVPTRMSAALLAEAYERIVPPRMRVLRSEVRRGDEGEQQAQHPTRRRAA
jgi:hypothetical protein